jgi:hypothetical protein
MSTSYLEEWYNCFSRKTNHNDIAKWSNPRDWDGASWKLIAGWVWSDFQRFVYRCSQVHSEYQKLGDLLKQKYGVSRIRQLTQLCYLAFGLGIPLKHYRAYQLFKPERWELVDQFLYEHGTLQRECISRSFPEEESILRNKLKFNKYCRKRKIPTPKVTAAFDEGRLVFPKRDAPKFPKQDLIVKELRGGQGRGVEKVEYNEEGGWEVGDKSYGREALVEHFAQRSAGNDGLLLQPAIRNHGDWRSFTSGGLSTVRVVTARRPEGGLFLSGQHFACLLEIRSRIIFPPAVLPAQSM